MVGHEFRLPQNSPLSQLPLRVTRGLASLRSASRGRRLQESPHECRLTWSLSRGGQCRVVPPHGPRLGEPIRLASRRNRLPKSCPHSCTSECRLAWKACGRTAEVVDWPRIVPPVGPPSAFPRLASRGSQLPEICPSSRPCDCPWLGGTMAGQARRLFVRGLPPTSFPWCLPAWRADCRPGAEVGWPRAGSDLESHQDLSEGSGRLSYEAFPLLSGMGCPPRAPCSSPNGPWLVKPIWSASRGAMFFEGCIISCPAECHPRLVAPWWASR